MADDKDVRQGVATPVASIEEDAKDSAQSQDESRVNDEADTSAHIDGEASDQDGAGDNDEEMLDAGDDDGKLTTNLYKAYKTITEALLDHSIKIKGNEDYYPSTLFKRLPNKRLLPDYYEVIKEPTAISTLRGKIQRKQYTGTAEFVRDFALISHNAQVYNRPNSQPVRDVLRLEEVFKEGLEKLVKDGLAGEDDIKFPDLGEIPYSTPEPDPVSEDEDAEDDGDGDEDDEEEDDSDDDKKTRRGRRTKGVARRESDDEDKAADAEQKKRGRPPKVITPTEARIDKILKSLRKVRAPNGQSMIGPFERLPDKAEFPDYYQVIQHPLAYDVLKKKAKRKKYASIDEFMKDVELMFKNAMTYNEDGSDVYKWAQKMVEEAKKSEAEERAKPDDEFMQAAEGRLPIPHIIYKGDMWKVGDWIHIQNPNDVTKPIIAQIYRTWKTANGEEWINACWYYRPEQTVHQYEKHFYPSEVVKTGQYRDHKIDEVLNKCFVMFYTRYSRGRPRNLPNDTEIYVCEARYNEDKFKFNKIKTWASCLPDEVRDQDYEMDLFDIPRKIKKVPSPLLSRLQDDAKPMDELPQPEWKNSNAPPLIGGIHKRARDENQSPPPEATPPPPAVPPPLIKAPSADQQINVQTPSYPNAVAGMNQAARPSPALPPQQPYNNTQYNPRPNYQNNSTFNVSTPASTMQQNNQAPRWPQQQQNQSYVAANPTSYQATPYNRNVQNVQPTQYPTQQNNAAQLQRGYDVYTLPDDANLSIPKEIRDQFPTDEQGRILFFTAPPFDNSSIITGKDSDEIDWPLEHSRQYLQSSKKRNSDAMLDTDMTEANEREDSASKRVAISVPNNVTEAFNILSNQISNSTNQEYKELYGQDWRERLVADLKHARYRVTKDLADDATAEKQRADLCDAHITRLNGQFASNSQGYITGWEKDFFTGTYLDDHDSRLPF